MHKFLLFLLPIIVFANNTLINNCTKCHKDKISKCKQSSHYTLKNAINITRKTWGIKNSNITLQTLPNSKNNISKPQDLVDDFLRRKCLRCHLNSKTINQTNNLCLSCHNTHTNRYDSKKAKPTQQKCLKCHNNEFIGTDYLGLFPHDYDKSYRTPITKNGYYPNHPYGIDFHHLNSDIHHLKGMSCISCHNNKNNKNWETDTKCLDCHTNLSKQNHKSYHKNISCSTCHSAWNISSYKLNILRDDSKNYLQWKRLTIQDDKYLEKFLKKAIKAKNKPNPMMPDYLTNKLKDGIWYSGWLFRRWENFFLINDTQGMIKIAKPIFQYHISYKNKNGTTILDNISKIDGDKIEAFLPKSPHTITKKAKSCQMCHNNKIMLDNHLINKDILKGKVLKGTNLTPTQLKKLSSPFYKSQRAKMLF